jgi:hypothetical protein
MVSIVGSRLGATTGADGSFVLERVPAGTLTVRVRLLGYRAVERAIRIPAGDTVRVDITLEPEAHVLAPVRTDAAPREP